MNAENFRGLHAFTDWGIENQETSYVQEGDYLIRISQDSRSSSWYMLIPQKDFENKYERI